MPSRHISLRLRAVIPFHNSRRVACGAVVAPCMHRDMALHTACWPAAQAHLANELGCLLSPGLLSVSMLRMSNVGSKALNLAP